MQSSLRAKFCCSLGRASIRAFSAHHRVVLDERNPGVLCKGRGKASKSAIGAVTVLMWAATVTDGGSARQAHRLQADRRISSATHYRRDPAWLRALGGMKSTMLWP